MPPTSWTTDPTPRPMSDPRCVAILAPNWLGDAVMALPAMADVRRRFPSARIVVAARRSVADLFRLVAFVDEVINQDVEALRASHADVALLLPNSFASAWLVRRAGIAERWGYATDWRGWLLTRAIPRPKRRLHQGAYYQHLVRALGIEALGIEARPLEPALTIPDSAVTSARELLASRGWNGQRPLVVLAPGAAYGTAKRWIPAHVSRLINDLVRQGRTCVLVGSRGDALTTRGIRDAVDDTNRAQVIDVSGETSLEMLAATLSIAHGCVANDSGAMHLAAAVGTPLVALFGPTREGETAPLTRSGGRAEVLTHPVWCRPCMLRECPIDHRCMTGIDPARVLVSLTRLLGSGPSEELAKGV